MAAGRQVLLATALGCTPTDPGPKPAGSDVPTDTDADTDDPGDTAGDDAPPPPSDDPGSWGPYGVGATTLEWVDHRGKALVAEVWYPAQVPPGAEPEPYPPTPLAVAAVRDVPPDLRGAPYPVVAFSHGYAGIRYQSVFLTEHLASHGYVIVSPDHVDNTFFDLDEDATVQVVLERPDDVRSALDELIRVAATRSQTLGGLVIDGDAAVMGHSFGAYTAMVLGGGVQDLDGFLAYCADNSNRACRLMESVDADALDGHGGSDPRFVTTIPMSPGMWYGFGADGAGLETVQRPLVLAGDADPVLEYATEARPSWDHMGAPKTLATFHGAGHYAFSDICLIAAILFEECAEEEGGWIDIADAQADTKLLVTAWLEHTLRGRDEMAALLTPEAWSDNAAVTVELD